MQVKSHVLQKAFLLICIIIPVQFGGNLTFGTKQSI